MTFQAPNLILLRETDDILDDGYVIGVGWELNME